MLKPEVRQVKSDATQFDFGTGLAGVSILRTRAYVLAGQAVFTHYLVLSRGTMVVNGFEGDLPAANAIHNYLADSDYDGLVAYVADLPGQTTFWPGPVPEGV